MLNPNTQQIASAFGYTPFSEDDAQQQFPADITWDPASNTPPVTGSTYRSKRGKLRCYWQPQSAEPELEGWYDVPTSGDIEEWSFDSSCLTPADDSVEPDHPDSWLSILGLI